MVQEGDPCPWTSCNGIVSVMPLSEPGMGHLGRLECDECATIFEWPEPDLVSIGPLVSLDSEGEMCHSQCTLLRIEPELHFPMNEVFEVPDEFNGHARGTFYYRNSNGVLRGPFMNPEEAGFDLCRRPFS